ncbi:hypothetical protein C2S53_018094 [Perilla frutescens var. hirtella]|uniref:Fe2OG dioxygenase domain-containing protein n=1 Tax=Perilla frutescens var. hirtella TaxID=608512 RepID=A0AAD4PBQ7_PERFH|nr:hypothetical protein C2S53_018094 [Perilla frutescens var. hirtella]
MASTAPPAPPPPPTITCVKHLAESANLTSIIPSNYAYYTNSAQTKASDPGDSIPIIDLSLLTSDNPDHKSTAIRDLDNALNHGIPEELMNGILEGTRDFFDLPEEEKPEFQPKDVVSPIRYGTSFNTEKEKIFCWRDFLKVFVHPHFNFPDRPESLREILLEYTGRIRKMVRELVGGVSEAMELDQDYVEEVLKLDSSFQKFGGNFYPPCPQPDQTIGLPPHNDPGLFTILLIHNGLAGLQIERHGQWFEVNPPQNSMIVNVGDQLEIFSNGRCKSSRHRAVVNKLRERLSIAVGNGPGKDVVVGPAAPLVEKDGGALYRSMKYQEYVESQLSRSFNGKSILEEQMMFHEDQI